MALINTTLTGTVANIYVSTADSVVSVAYFCNQDGLAANLNVYAVPSGGTANVSTQIYKSVEIAGNDTFVVDMEKIVLAAGETLRANASGNIVATVSYVGI
jgi:hypothetical protein